MRTGIKTSEFWISFAVILAYGFLQAFDENMTVDTAGAIMPGVIAVVYATARAWIKVTDQKTDLNKTVLERQVQEQMEEMERLQKIAREAQKMHK